MAKNAAFRILVAYEADEEFAVVIRPQEKAARGTAQSEAESDIELGFGKSNKPVIYICGIRRPSH